MVTDVAIASYNWLKNLLCDYYNRENQEEK